MSMASELPAWAALPAAILVLLGAAVTLIGSVGLLRLGTFYARVHAPTLGTTFGMGCILAASALCFSVLEGKLVIHEILIAAFVTLTTPVTLMLLARASLYRDRTEGNRDVPGSDDVEDLMPPKA
ncbi:monovalent cation/H(+) antiporter subunit G [Microvirga lotononidis]|uniref:Monovalent cation/proton antiporter, MnhG/PhaG subunit n=1 Tax=Microvirga lotononidis TaxID=864069 RepID=I4YKY0_9HYPH|nr:monovalent cation/H(+) antiporter subunit G [Microvirga lotononidis]EIM24622.1 monovalent cation/proton antiporter, MnhG/PhaG subunit [Microvirga lotononidis]WQO26638.1 monovalent cation/H(+) antiporter subunit G [Microvirga lotononidis]